MSDNYDGYSSPEPGNPKENRPCQDSRSETRRGRPKAAAITNLIIEGSTSESQIRCEVCSRVFPRDKSLQAHRRVHTGERPYSCDFPGCLRKFKQSGQLKTHQRLHTGERPFLCSAEGCTSRFTHANRHCSSHPLAPLIRTDDKTTEAEPANLNTDVKQWLIKYRAEREVRCNDKKESVTPNPKQPRLELLTPKTEDRELADMTNLTESDYNNWCSPRKSPLKTPKVPLADRSKPVKNLFLTDPEKETTLLISPRKRELPKKRWLRIAYREANLDRPTVLRHAAGPSIPPVTPPEDERISYSMLTPPYSDKQCYDEMLDEELAVPLDTSHVNWRDYC